MYTFPDGVRTKHEGSKSPSGLRPVVLRPLRRFIEGWFLGGTSGGWWVLSRKPPATHTAAFRKWTRNVITVEVCMLWSKQRGKTSHWPRGGKKEERVTRVLGRPYNKSIILFPKAKEKSCRRDARNSAVKYTSFFLSLKRAKFGAQIHHERLVIYGFFLVWCRQERNKWNCVIGKYSARGGLSRADWLSLPPASLGVREKEDNVWKKERGMPPAAL